MGTLKRIGHKGADAIVPGNTLESFAAAVESGVDLIELDVLRPRADFARSDDWRRADAGPARESGGPLLVAHDWGDAARDPITLQQALDAFARPPLDRVDLDLDLKIAGRENEVVDALRSRGLLARAMVSSMEVESLEELRRLEAELRVGWTVPRITRDWSAIPSAKPLVVVSLLALRASLPRIVRRRAPALGVRVIWAYQPVITRRLVTACRSAGLDLYAWTVDDLPTMRHLAHLGVDGICTNDPRLFAEL